MRTDKELEAIARQLCMTRGVDPDCKLYSYRGSPNWEYVVPEVLAFVNMLDSVNACVSEN